MSVIVLKFGGTSLKDAASMRKAAEIVKRAPRKKIVALSAAAGVTNSLLSAARHAANGEFSACENILREIECRHIAMLEELPLEGVYYDKTSASMSNYFSSIREYCEGIFLLRERTPRSLDEAASFGELLSSLIFTAYLASSGENAVLVDARTFMRTDDNFTSAKPDFAAINALAEKNLFSRLSNESILITQGFIGADANGATTTLGRGGSDFSAAIIGAAADADEIQIWTDVSGIFSADPNHLPEAVPASLITYEEARQLSFFGAKVLHPETLLPAIKKNIPVRILNTFAPEDRGTLIMPEISDELPHFRAIAVKNNCVLISSSNEPANAENLAKLHADFLSQIQATGLPLLTFAGGENRAFAIVEADNLSAAETKVSLYIPAAAVEECAIICACGPQIAKPGEIQSSLISKFINATIRCGAYSNLTAVSGTSACLAVLPRDKSHAALIAAHKIISSQN